MTVEERIRRGAAAGPGAYLELTKPGITFFVAVTAVVGFTMATLPALDWMGIVHVAVGIGSSTAGALALNQYIERDRDGLMLRTQLRPIPSGRITPGRARAFGWLLLVAGIGHLWFWLGWVPALLTAASAFLYDAVYTPLKLRSPIATPVGAIPGALPALIGWTAFDGSIDPEGIALFGILFLWQLIHVLALGWNLRADYERAGFQLIPPGSARLISWFMVGYAALLLPVSMLPSALHMTGAIYLVGAVVLGAAMIAATVAFLVDPTKKRCSRVFLGSLLYHPLLLALMVVGAL